MAIIVNIRDYVLGKTLKMSVERDTTLEEVLINSADYLGKKPGVYLIKFGNRILPGDITVSEAGILSGSRLELLPDPQS